MTEVSLADTRAAIRTRYAGPTDSRGSRIIVTAKWWSGHKSRRAIYDWDHALEPKENHAAAAQKWLNKYNTYGATVVPPGLNYDGDYYWTWTAA